MGLIHRDSDFLDSVLGEQDPIVRSSPGYQMIRDFIISALIVLVLLVPIWLPAVLELAGFSIDP